MTVHLGVYHSVQISLFKIQISLFIDKNIDLHFKVNMDISI